MKIIQTIGNTELLKREETLFLCSKHAPFNCYPAIFRWVDQLTESDCIICFNSSELEMEVMKTMLVDRIPTILVVMNHFNESENENLQVAKALRENRLLVLVLKKDEVGRYAYVPRLRNTFVLEMANRVVCGFINKNGSIFPILAGRNNIRWLIDDFLPMAAEETIDHQRWRLSEDKTLLHMFYADMGIHAIKRQINRSYAAIRSRIRAIALSDEGLKGREFEDYVIEILNVNQNPHLTLLEWRGDKAAENTFPVNNRYPDLILTYQEASICPTFAIECKWRKWLPRTAEKNILEQNKLKLYFEFESERHIPIFIVLGVGGQPCDPSTLYVMPLHIYAAVMSNLTSIHICKKQEKEILPYIIDELRQKISYSS